MLRVTMCLLLATCGLWAVDAGVAMGAERTVKLSIDANSWTFEDSASKTQRSNISNSSVDGGSTDGNEPHARLRRGTSSDISCKLFDAAGEVAVDLGVLTRKSDEDNYAVRDDNGHVYYFNVCGYLTSHGLGSHCASKFDSTSACQDLWDPSAGGTGYPHNIGTEYSPQFIDTTDLSKGARLLTSAPSKPELCHGKYTRRMEILFKCGPSRGRPVFLEESPECAYFIEWKTDLLCEGVDTSADELPCFTQNEDGYTVDLAPLVSGVSNWEVTSTSGSTMTNYFLSVCRPLVHTKSLPTLCVDGQASSSAGCSAVAGGGSVVVFGNPTTPKLQDGDVTITYTKGPTGAIAQLLFSCPTDRSVGLGNPVLSRVVDNHYIFTWESTAACIEEHSIVGANCKVEDENGNEFDLTPLAGTVFDVSGDSLKSNVDYKFSICRNGIQCGTSVGDVCQTITSESNATISKVVSQSASNSLELVDGDLRTVFNSNIKCPTDDPFQIVVVYTCNPKALPGMGHEASLVAVDSTDPAKTCMLTMEVETSLVCLDEVVDCVLEDNGKTFNLAGLSRTTYWSVASGDDTFLINVCRPVDAPDKGCEGVGGCQVTSSDNVFELGKVTKPSFTDGKLSVTYTDGTYCPKAAKARTMTITFECDETASIEGHLVALPENELCSYEFLWQTSAACEVKPESHDQCQVTDPSTDTTFDLSGLASTINDGDRKVTDHYGVTYHFGLCGQAKACHSGDAVCDNAKVSFGKISNVLTFNGGISLLYSNGAKCSQGNKATLINFVCDPSEDGATGPHVLSSSDDCLLEMNWPTTLACRDEYETIDCSVMDGNKRYDLTPLINNEGNYMTHDTNGNAFIVNVCRPMIPDTARICPYGISSCMIDKNKKGINIGIATGSPQISKDGDNTVVLTYTNGTNGAKTRIEFMCPSDAESTDLNNLIYLDYSTDNKMYSFRMYTESACPARRIVGDKCKIIDEVTGTGIDLNPLRSSEPYVVEGDGYEFQLGICESVKCGSHKDLVAGACQSKNDNHWVTGVVNQQPMFENEALRLVYAGGQPCHNNTINRKTVISFVCDPSAGKGQPTFLKEDTNCLYLFEWKTELACKPELTHCSAINEKTLATYDLDALIRRDDIAGSVDAKDYNWVAKDPREGGKYAYEINVCRPLVSKPNDQCGPFASACQTIADDEHMDQELGFPINPPFISDEGVLTLVYEQGSICKGIYKRKTKIEFTCNETPGQLGEPVFRAETDQCEYIFDWHSSAACPRGGSFTTAAPTTDCSITVHSTGETIDLSSLEAQGQLQTTGTIGGQSATMHVGICAAATQCSDSAGACVVKDGETTNIGDVSRKLFYDGDALTLVYKHGSCQTTLTILCDRTAFEIGLRYVDSSGCNYRFEVLTNKVCPRMKQVPCSVRDESGDTAVSYDLSDLVMIRHDYEAQTESTDVSIDFNVCRSLVQPRPGCETFHAGCFTSHGKSYPLGPPSRPYVTDNHQLRIDTSAPGCQGDLTKPSNISIIFECSVDGIDYEPILEGNPMDGECNYLITWTTTEACSIQQTTEAPSTHLDAEDCIVANEYDRFDLSRISAAKARNADTDGKTGDLNVYDVAVCNTVSCPGTSNAAACQTTGTASYSLGQFLNKPVLGTSEDGTVSLTYTEGSSCPDKQRSSHITFKCPEEGVEEGPVYEGETQKCEYEFTWYTNNVCPNQMIPRERLACSIENPNTGTVYDLHRLARANTLDNWLARNSAELAESDKYNFFINVCRPLATKQFDNGEIGEECRGAGVCQQSGDGKHHWTAGFASSEPEFLASGDVLLRYKLPTSYPTKCHQFVRSASITFSCTEGTLGRPVFVGETDECEYQFVWETSVVCEYSQNQGKDCKVTDEETGTVFDLSPLAKQIKTVVDTATDRTYQLVVCEAPTEDAIRGCDGGVGVCQHKEGESTYYNGGVINDTPFKTSGGAALEYTNGQRCHDSKFERTSFIEFVCNPTAGEGTPVFVKEADDCSYYFKWETQYACASQTDFPCIVLGAQGEQYDLSPLKRLDMNWLVNNEKDDEFTYIMNVCHNVIRSGVAEECPDNSAICQLSSKTGRSYSLGHASEPKWANGQLQMELQDGDRCGDGTQRVTKVLFFCKKDSTSSQQLGTPFVYDEGHCSYTIHWYTSAACEVNDAPTTTPAQDCRVVDGVTGATYDFSSITHTLETDPSSDNTYFQFSPCKPITCDGHESNMCQHTNEGIYSLGTARSLSANGGAVIMQLRDGTMCPAISKHRDTTVVFKCPEDTSSSTRLIFDEETSKCSYRLTVFTKLACANDIGQCVVKDTREGSGWVYDLSPLSVRDGAIHVPISDEDTIDFNICAPVNTPGCSSTSGACLTTSGGETYSLGEFEGATPTMMADKPQVHLQYTRGSCPMGGSSTVEIKFTCAPGAGDGKPTFTSINGCTYFITWATCRVCPGANPCKDVMTTPGRTTKRPLSTTHDASSDTNTTTGSHNGGKIAFVVILLVVIIVGGVYIGIKPDLRDRVLGMCIPSSSTAKPKFTYKQLDDLGESAKSQLLFDESDEEDLFGGDDASAQADTLLDSAPPAPTTSTAKIMLDDSDDDDDDLLV
eukprot:m.42710 g.42710  ORF g.42710 m.42710 type:complete len:2590 (-) comp10724_c3_seq2:42-7811(-)